MLADPQSTNVLFLCEPRRIPAHEKDTTKKIEQEKTEVTEKTEAPLCLLLFKFVAFAPFQWDKASVFRERFYEFFVYARIGNIDAAPC